MIEPVCACVRARACCVLCAVRCALHVHVPFAWCLLLVDAGACLPADPCCSQRWLHTPHFASSAQAKCAGVAGAAIVAGAVAWPAHQPAQAGVCRAAAGAVAALLPIFSSIILPLLECEPFALGVVDSHYSSHASSRSHTGAASKLRNQIDSRWQIAEAAGYAEFGEARRCLCAIDYSARISMETHAPSSSIVVCSARASVLANGSHE